MPSGAYQHAVQSRTGARHVAIARGHRGQFRLRSSARRSARSASAPRSVRDDRPRGLARSPRLPRTGARRAPRETRERLCNFSGRREARHRISLHGCANRATATDSALDRSSWALRPVGAAVTFAQQVEHDATTESSTASGSQLVRGVRRDRSGQRVARPSTSRIEPDERSCSWIGGPAPSRSTVRSMGRSDGCPPMRRPRRRSHALLAAAERLSTMPRPRKPARQAIGQRRAAICVSASRVTSRASASRASCPRSSTTFGDIARPRARVTCCGHIRWREPRGLRRRTCRSTMPRRRSCVVLGAVRRRPRSRGSAIDLYADSQSSKIVHLRPLWLAQAASRLGQHGDAVVAGISSAYVYSTRS